MTNEQKVLLQLVSATLNGVTANVQNPETVDWLSVAKESDIQAVLPMAFDAAALSKQNIPEAIYKMWSDRAVAYLLKNVMVHQSQQELIELLNKSGYRYAIIKGESSVRYYRQSDLRALGDVDFIVDQEKSDEIKKLLCDNGYTSMLEDHECHIVFKKTNAHLEMHKEISGIPYGEVGEKVREYMSDLLDSCQESSNFNTPQKHHHGLILLLHTKHHLLGEGVGLRHLCDWGAFVSATHTEPFWKETLLPFLKNVGLMTLACVLTKTCASALGTPCPEWADADEKLCNDFLEDVFSGGNFGVKDVDRTRTGMIITNRGKDGISNNKYRQMYKILRRNIHARHPNTKKYPILYPFYFVAKVIKYMGLRIIGKRPSIKKLCKDTDKRMNVYQQLKIFEV